MKFHSDFEFIIYYILNKATPEELSGIEMALEKRKKITPFSLKDIDFQKMAKEISSKISGSYTIDVKALAKRIITQLILEKEPNISEEHLKTLLEYYIPEEKTSTNLPKEILYVMVQHFIDYSLGKMDQKTVEELKRSTPNWYEKYWNAFPYSIRVLIADFLKAKMNSYEFWQEVEKILK